MKLNDNSGDIGVEIGGRQGAATHVRETCHALQRFGHDFAAFDADLVRRVGAIPTEYVYYFYDPRRYLDGVARAGSSRGQDVLGLNQEMLTAIGRAFADGDVHAAWSAYAGVIGVRHDTYMRTDISGDSGQVDAGGQLDEAADEVTAEAGVDPAQATLFMQSPVPEHAVLHLRLSMLTPLGSLAGGPA